MKKTLLLAVVACLLFAAPVMAKEGFYLGAFIPMESLSGDVGDVWDSGTGWGLRAGMGFNQYVSIEAKYAKTAHDFKVGSGSTDFNSLAGDVKLSFPLTSLDSAQVMTLEPYLMAGYAHYESTKPEAHKSDGFQWGFGIELYLFKELSVQAGWTTTDLSFDTKPDKLKGDVNAIDFGVIYHFI